MEKTFDCVEMKRAAQEALRRETDGLNQAELQAFWSQKNREFAQELREAHEANVWLVRENPEIQPGS
jgi:hypothetical protein